jgi:hypothetical protein
MLQNVRQFQIPLQRYTALMDLQVSPSDLSKRKFVFIKLQLAKLYFQSLVLLFC